MSCGDYSSPSESENDDEIRQIKHAMVSQAPYNRILCLSRILYITARGQN